MNWKELIQSVERRQIKLLSTATTGLGDEDELLAVCISNAGEAAHSIRTYVKKVTDREKVMKSQEHHQITPERSMSGQPEQVFVNALTEEMKDSVFFTYNPAFQSKFIGRLGLMPTLYNLPLFIKGADSKMLMEDNDIESLDAIQQFLAKRMGGTMAMNKLAALHGAEKSVIELPVEFSCRSLLVLWDYLQEIPVTVQGTFL